MLQPKSLAISATLKLVVVSCSFISPRLSVHKKFSAQCNLFLVLRLENLGKWQMETGLACIAHFPSRVVSYTRVVLILLLVGCDSGEFKTYPVKGTVTFSDGTPLPVGKIYFDTRDEQYGLGVGATGNIKEDGTFELRTYVPGDGAPPGQYIVYIRGALTGGRVSMNVEERQPGMP